MNNRVLSHQEEFQYRLLMRAMGHPMVLEILADCADCVDTESSAMAEAGEHNSIPYTTIAADYRKRADSIRKEDPELWD